MEDWEHKFAADKCLEGYHTYKEGMQAWTENKSKCYYLVLQHYPQELKIDLKNLAPSEVAAADIDGM